MHSPIRTAASLRPSLAKRQTQTQAEGRGGPATPTRQYSLLGSPGFRPEDDQSVFEIGTRCLRAGVSGDLHPKCILRFHPDAQRRVGDYRVWTSDYDAGWKSRSPDGSFGHDHELWSSDLRYVDMGLVDDKLERALRETSVKYLLTDNKYRRVVLALSPGLPVPLISVILNRFFLSYQCPTITVFPTSILNTIAAGLRSALVVDIGWRETIITPVSELRELSCYRTCRAMKMLAEETGRFLWRQCQKARGNHDLDEVNDNSLGFVNEISFDEVEDVMMRVVWCNSRDEASSPPYRSGHTVDQSDPTSQKMAASAIPESQDDSRSSDPLFSIPLRSVTPPITLHLAFSSLSTPTEIALLRTPAHADNDELSITDLMYEALLNIPIEARGLCMSRIVFTGGGSFIPGLKQRILDDLKHRILLEGWERVHGRAFYEIRRRNKEQAEQKRQMQNGTSSKDSTERKQPVIQKESDNVDEDDLPPNLPPLVPAAEQTHARDPIEEVLERESAKTAKSTVKGEVRGVKTFGAFAGASLLATTRLRGIATIEREKFLTHGLNFTMAKDADMNQRPGPTGAAAARRTTLDGGSTNGLGAYWM